MHEDRCKRVTNLEAAERFVFDQLSGGAALIAALAAPVTGYGFAIYSEVIPQESNLPAVAFQFLAVEEFLGGQSTRCGSVFRFIVKGVTAGKSKSGAHTIAELVDTLLHQVNDVVDGYSVNSYRLEPWSSTIVEDGKRFNQVGGIYAVIVRKT